MLLKLREILILMVKKMREVEEVIITNCESFRSFGDKKFEI